MDLVPLDSKLLALLGTGGLNALGLPKRDIFLLSVVVAGTTHCPEIETLAPQINPGTLLRMVRQPANEYDDRAIALFLDQTRIGYVPQHLNLIISRLMDAGKEFYAKVTARETRNKWVRIKADIYMVE